MIRKNKQLAVLASDIESLPTITIKKDIQGYEVPFDHIRDKVDKIQHRLSVEDALEVAKATLGLSGVENEAKIVLCDYVENQLENNE